MLGQYPILWTSEQQKSIPQKKVIRVCKMFTYFKQWNGASHSIPEAQTSGSLKKHSSSGMDCTFWIRFAFSDLRLLFIDLTYGLHVNRRICGITQFHSAFQRLCILRLMRTCEVLCCFPRWLLIWGKISSFDVEYLFIILLVSCHSTLDSHSPISWTVRWGKSLMFEWLRLLIMLLWVSCFMQQSWEAFENLHTFCCLKLYGSSCTVILSVQLVSLSAHSYCWRYVLAVSREGAFQNGREPGGEGIRIRRKSGEEAEELGNTGQQVWRCFRLARESWKFV